MRCLYALVYTNVLQLALYITRSDYNTIDVSGDVIKWPAVRATIQLCGLSSEASQVLEVKPAVRGGKLAEQTGVLGEMLRQPV